MVELTKHLAMARLHSTPGFVAVLGVWVWGFWGFGVWGLGFRVWGLGVRVWGLGVWGLVFRGLGV